MKDTPSGNDAPELVSSTFAFNISRAKIPQNLEQKTYTEDLKKTLDMYIVRLGSKGALMRRCSGSYLMLKTNGKFVLMATRVAVMLLRPQMSG